MGEHLGRDQMPQDARELAELLAHRLELATGRLELIFNQGRYVDGYRQERMRPTALQGMPIDASDDQQPRRRA